MEILQGYIFGILYGIVCIALALIAYKLGMPKKYSRKLVHILVGFEWVILYHYMGAGYHFLIVCILFLLLLLVSYIKNLMPMISSDSDNAPGTVYYALAMTVMAVICLFVPNMILPFGIGVIATSVGDGFAGLFGQLIKKYNPKIYKEKSLFGTLINLLSTGIGAFIFGLIFDLKLDLWQCAMIGLFSAGLELITAYGLDNIVITLGASLLTYSFLYLPLIEIFIIPIVATPFVIAIVLEKKVLTRIGLLFAIILDAAVSITLGNFGFVLLLSFLVFSVIIDKVKKHFKKNDEISEKGECRDGIQVLANGFIPMLMALMYAMTVNEVFIVGYVAALAEAFADTSASGMGIFSKHTFDPFKFKRTECGLSGGMSLIGTLSSLIGSFIIALIALAFGAINAKLMLIAASSAFLGAIFDSMLGSLVQIKYKCPRCGIVTEKGMHCGKSTKKHSGFEFFDNDVVNLMSGLFAAALAAVLSSVI